MTVDVSHIVRDLFRKNVGLKILALGLAGVLWWFVVGESKVQVGLVVPLEIRDLPPGMMITNKVERQVEVRLAGPSSLIGTLPQSELSAVLGLASVKPGRSVVTLDERAIKVPPGIKVQRIYPNAIEVVVERLEKRPIPVSVRLGGTAQVRRRIEKVDVVPATVEVEAPPEEFSRIRTVSTEEIVPEPASGTFTTNARVELRDGHARIVGKPTVRVTVQFR